MARYCSKMLSKIGLQTVELDSKKDSQLAESDSNIGLELVGPDSRRSGTRRNRAERKAYS